MGIRLRLTSWVVIAAFALQAVPARALAEGGTNLSLSQELPGAGAGNEFVSGNFPGAVLMPVNLWGAVGKPGIHHIPMRTDLITLLSLAGGPVSEAQLDKVIIKRRSKGEEQVIKIDADELLTEPGVHSPVLEANDIVIVPRTKPMISPNTVTVIGFIGSVISVVLAAIVLGNQVGKK